MGPSYPEISGYARGGAGASAGEILDDSLLRPGRRDGQWIVIQDWTQCNLACGGGVQTLQRLCVPPSEGGADCQGEGIMTRPCNTQPCRGPVHKMKAEITSNPVLKMVTVSPRKQRYEIGIIKEGDMDWMREDLPSPGEAPRLPVRVVLNNRTLSVFEANHYDTIAFSVNLHAIKKIELHPKDPKACFVVTTDDEKRITLCAMRGDSSDSMENIRKDWVKQIYFFRDHCRTEHEIFGDT